MAWRFRKSFKVIPGVRLNLTARGLSATFGASPFSINVGPRGTYANVGIPGTGVWTRQRLDEPSESHPSGIVPTALTPTPPSIPLAPTPVGMSGATTAEIRSSSTELLNSEGLRELRALLRTTYEERFSLESEVATAEQKYKLASGRYESWAHGVLLKRVFQRAFENRQQTAEIAQAELAELREQLRMTTLATQIDIQREQAEPYYKMRDEYAALTQCQAIWDTLQRSTVDRRMERSAADQSITREPVRFLMGCCELIQWEEKIPQLQNQNGGDLYLYPGFVLYRASNEAFALIESREVEIIYRPVRFIEEQTIPSDAQVIGQVWKKANKDGGPDRRFRDNYQIPLVLYGALVFQSASGLHEEYMLSNAALAERFATAWKAFTGSLAPLAQGANPVR